MRLRTMLSFAALAMCVPASAFAQIDFSSELDSINTECGRTDNPIVINQDNYADLQAEGVPIGFLLPNAVDALVSMCVDGKGLAERREYDVEIVRQAIRENFDEVRFVHEPELADDPDLADRPNFQFADGVWTIGVASTTSESFDQWYYYYLGFNAGMDVNGFPLAEAREHNLAWAHVDDALARANAACEKEFTVEMDWEVWTGDVFNLPWVEPFDAVINNHFGPDSLGERCASILDAFEQECGKNDGGPEARAFVAGIDAIRCLPDPMAAEWNDPYEPPTDYETGNVPEGLALWNLNGTNLDFYFWAGSWNTGRATEVLIQDEGTSAPPRCDELPDTCAFLDGAGGNNSANNTTNNDPDPDNGGNNGTNGGDDGTDADGGGDDTSCSSASGSALAWWPLLLVGLILRRQRRR